jgi:ABC-type transport system substrate-binding protein
VKVWAWREVGKEARYLVSVLRRLGYRAQLEEKKSWDEYFPTILDPKTRPQSGIIGLLGVQYGSQVIDLFRCGLSDMLARFCDRRFDRKAARARNLYETDPEGSTRMWAQLDRELVDEAPYVPLFNSRGPLLASKRVGNWQYHPSEDVLFDQLWVR